MISNLNESKWTSVAISKDNYKELQELSRQIIKGVKLTIPQTIKYLAKDGLVRSNQSKELLNELTGNNRKVI
jgi:hypothetical protein